MKKNNQTNLNPNITENNTFSNALEHFGFSDFPEEEIQEHMAKFNANLDAEDTQESLSMRKLHTADSINTLHILEGHSYDPTNVLLFKGVPQGSTEFDIINLVRRIGTVTDIYLVRHKQYAYVEFKEFSSAVECYKTFNLYKPQIKKSLLYVFFTGKTSIVKPNTLLSPVSRFLLLVFQKALIPINQEFVCNMLSPYGNCNKIYIFQKKFLQAIVEMEDVGQAMLVKQNLDGASVNDQAFVSVLYIDQKEFLSHEEQLREKERDLELLTTKMEQLNTNNDHETVDDRIYPDMPKKINTKKILNYQNGPMTDTQINEAFSFNSPPFIPEKRNNIQNGMINNQQNLIYPNPNKIYKDKQDIIHPGPFIQNRLPVFNTDPDLTINRNIIPNNAYSFIPGFNKPMINEQSSSLSPQIQNYVRNINQIPPKPKSAMSFELQYNFIDKNMNINNKMTPLIQTKEYHTVLVQNLPIGLTSMLIFNLFGMYGNVRKIKIFGNNPDQALVEYEYSAQATAAKENLDKCPLYNTWISVTMSPQEITMGQNGLNDHDNRNNNDIITDFSETRNHRYKIMGSKNYKNIAAPSKVLHLSNLCEDKDEYFYCCLFKDFGTIINMHELRGSAKMYLMEMQNISEAVSILMHFHNYDIEGKFLKVSFSKYPKIKE